MCSALVRAELEAYRAEAGRVRDDDRSGCAGWLVRDVHAHLATTVERFVASLHRARAGDLRVPFRRQDLDVHNARLVDEFTGDPMVRLAAAVAGLLRMADDPAELTAHLYGPISMGLQLQIVLFELALHHHDIAPADRPYVPTPPTVQTLGALCREVLRPVSFAHRHWRVDTDEWTAILALSGRTWTG